MIDCNEWRTEKRHECANMGTVKRLELWRQLYRTSLPVRDLENFRPMDFWSTECTKTVRSLSRKFQADGFFFFDRVYQNRSLSMCRSVQGDQPDLLPQPIRNSWPTTVFPPFRIQLWLQLVLTPTGIQQNFRKTSKIPFNLLLLLTSIHKLYLSVPCYMSRHNTRRQMSLVSSISTTDFSLTAPIRGKGARPFLSQTYVRNRRGEGKN